MPSLLKYFAFVGAGLLTLLTLANFLLEPSTGAKTVAAQPKPLVVQHDPMASKIERWRDDQAALKAAENARAKPVAVAESAPATPATVVVAKAPAPAPVQPVSQPAPSAPVAQAQAQPAAVPAAMPQAPAMQVADTSANIEAVPTEAERAADLKRKKAETARKKRLAEARAAKARELTDSSRQDQFYYGRQQGYAQRPIYGQQQAYAPAPRQDFGPFGLGRGW